MRGPQQVCAVYCRKGNYTKICVNIVFVLACEKDARVIDENILSGEYEEVFSCDILGKSFDESGEEG